MTLYVVVPIRFDSVTVSMKLTSLHTPCWENSIKQHEFLKMVMSNTSLSFHLPLSPRLTHPVLDVYVLSTDGQVQDFRFPQTSKGGASLQLSSNTVKVNSKNGEKHLFYVESFNHGFSIFHPLLYKWVFFLHLEKHTCLLSHWDSDEKIDTAWGY